MLGLGRSRPAGAVPCTASTGIGIVWRGMLLPPDVSLLDLFSCSRERSMTEVRPHYFLEVVE